jgi:DNA-binding NtrC family response regulator
MTSGCILSFGNDIGLMSSRSMILRNAGYEVIEVYSYEDALQRADSDCVDLVLVCHTVPDAQQERLVLAIKNHRRLMPVLSIADNDVLVAVGKGMVVNSAPDLLLSSIQIAISGYSNGSSAA